MREKRPQHVVWTVGLIMLLVGPVGCGSRQVAPAKIARAQEAYDNGLQAFARADYRTAIAQLSEALDTPGLVPDLVVHAYLTRARCYAETGDFAPAQSDLAAAEKGAGDLDQLYLVRGVLLRKRGDESGAQAEFEKARRINPRVELPR